jgi:NADH dehydrogenase
MNQQEIHVVTGAYGFSGKYIAQRLLDNGHIVKTLTNSPERQNPFAGRIEASPYNFDDPAALVETLKGATVLYNTYWVRFNHAIFAHGPAVENTRTLFEAAKAAGVERIVHVSITNPSQASPLEYFRGKAELEQALIGTGIPYAILRPAVLFGREDILINNIAWMLRKMPIFGLFGQGNYGIQPIYVDDLAKLAVEQGQSRENIIIDAIGPESFTYRELVQTIGRIIGKNRMMLPISPRLGYLVSRILSWLLNDVLVTEEEIEGLMGGLLHVDSPPAGETKLSDWAREHADTVGRRYTSELARRRDRKMAYQAN